ncbi:MAG: 2-oxoglutarate dehydrogenase E1 component, partial [Pseudomonadota bacterium]
ANQATFCVHNSSLSEAAILGFDYGYSIDYPDMLASWEAQFGDFANGAQVHFDQFLASSESKWGRVSGLVMLLPHGYEGQGPEHSSARLERYLQLCAEDNMQVAYPTTPANYFHILRRQLNRAFRKPLVLMTPKSMLRNKLATSKLEELAEGTYFHRLLWDGAQSGELDFALKPDDQIRRVIMCTGKVYYDLVEEREKLGASDVYLLRIEQLYPFPHRALAQELARFPQADMVWCQEEHRNMGAYSFVESRIEWALAQADARVRRPRYVGRAAAAAPATGLMSKHLAQLQAFLDDAFAEGEAEFRVAAE